MTQGRTDAATQTSTRASLRRWRCRKPPAVDRVVPVKGGRRPRPHRGRFLCRPYEHHGFMDVTEAAVSGREIDRRLDLPLTNVANVGDDADDLQVPVGVADLAADGGASSEIASC